VTELVSGLCDLQATELLPLIRRHDDKGYIATSWIGDIDDIARIISEPPPEFRTQALEKLPEVYEGLRKSFQFEDLPPGAEAEAEVSLVRKDEDDWEDGGAWSSDPSLENPENAVGPDPWSTPVPQRRVPEKIGRNEPCPCGSGKKYKKCCG